MEERRGLRASADLEIRCSLQRGEWVSHQLFESFTALNGKVQERCALMQEKVVCSRMIVTTL